MRGVILLFAGAIACAAPMATLAKTRPATKGEIELARASLSDHLKDADSAKFKDVRFGSGENSSIICGQVNAKNSYGAYSGFTTFMGMKVGDGKQGMILVMAVDSESEGPALDVCRQKGM